MRLQGQKATAVSKTAEGHMRLRGHLLSPTKRRLGPSMQEWRIESRLRQARQGQQHPVCSLAWGGLRASVSPSLPAILLKILSREKVTFKVPFIGNFLTVQWLGLCASTAGGKGSIPGRGTKISHAARLSPQKKKLKK